MNVWLQKIMGKHWICFASPIGLTVRLSTCYSSHQAADNACAIYGFTVVPKPPSVLETEAELRRIAKTIDRRVDK